MFTEGDRVKLVKDFDNEPGIVAAGTKGTIVMVMPGDDAFFDYFVRLDDDGSNEVVSKVNARLGGFPLFQYEIEAA